MKHPIGYARLRPGDRYFVNANGLAVRLTFLTKGEEFNGLFYPDGGAVGYRVRVKPEDTDTQAEAHHDYQHEVRARVSGEEAARGQTLDQLKELWK